MGMEVNIPRVSHHYVFDLDVQRFLCQHRHNYLQFFDSHRNPQCLYLSKYYAKSKLL